DHSEPRFGHERGIDEFVPVAAVGEREERFDGRDRAAINGNTGNRAPQTALGLGAHCRRHLRDGPQRARAHAACSFSAAATSSWSLNGTTRSPKIWPDSWPLPAINNTSP